MASRRMVELRRQGAQAEKIVIDVEDLLKWCQEQDRPVDAVARAEYAAAKVKEKYEQ